MILIVLLFGWLTEAWTQEWTSLKVDEVQNISQYNTEKKSKDSKEMWMLKC